MSGALPVRVRIALLAVLLFALASDGHGLLRVVALHRQFRPPDEVTEAESRLRPLKALLPSHGVVGYIADPRQKGPLPDFVYARRFYLTRYSLTPLLVIDSTSPEFVVGHFAVPSRGAPSGPPLFLERDFGDGVMLFRQRPR